MADKNEIAELLDSIRVVQHDIDAAEADIKTLKDMAKEQLESMPEFIEVAECTEALKQAKERLKQRLLARQQYNDLMEKIATKTADLADDKEILSEHLIEYRIKTHERQIEVNTSNGDARPIEIKAKLGKQMQKYQTNIFGKNNDLQITVDTISN